MELTKRGDELFLRTGNIKREPILPQILTMRTATKAEFTEDGWLEVHFE